MTSAVSFLREFRTPAELDAGQSVRSNEEAFRAGVIAGREEARQDARAELRDAVTELKNALTLSEQSRAAMYQAAQRDASAAVTAVVRAICPRLAELGLADAARDLITDSLEGSPRPIIVHAAPATASSLRESLGAEGLPGVEVLEQDGLSPLRLDVNWAGGSAEIDFDAVISRILEMAADLDASRSPNTESEAQ